MHNPNWKALHANNIANEAAVAEAEGKNKTVAEPEVDYEKEHCNDLLMPTGFAGKLKQEKEHEKEDK